MSKKQKQRQSTKTVLSTPSEKNQINHQKPTTGFPLLPGIIVLFITFLCFSNSLNNEFVNWDDDKNFYENPLIQNLDDDNFWQTTKEIFSSGVIGNYNPLSIWTFALEKKAFGFESPYNWHLDNLLLHLLCVLLVYYIALMLGLSWRGAVFVALLFGIHPMRVESVAWVTERKDVLFGVFYLGALFQYIKYKKDQKSWRWAWMTLFFALSLFSKIQAVSLPLSMMAIDYYLDHKWVLKSIISKTPFFLMSLAFGVLGIYMLKDFGSITVEEDVVGFSFVQRLFVGTYSFVVYLIKLVVPFTLSPLHPYPDHFPAVYYPSMLIVPIMIYTLYKSYQKEIKIVFFGFSFFIVNIIFLLQIVSAGQGYLADRFTYIGYLGLFLIMGYYFDQVIKNKPQRMNMVIGITSIYLVVLGYITHNQNKIWKNSETMWTHVLKQYPNSTLPYGNRGIYYRTKGRYEEALADFNKTIEMKDNQPQVYNSRARLFFILSKGQDSLLLALKDYNKAIEYLPTDGEFRINRGATYARLGENEKALKDFNEGLKLKPDHYEGYLNRSVLYNNLGKIELALKDLETYLSVNSNNSDLWFQKGLFLRTLERNEDAITAFSKALDLKTGNSGMFYYERSRTYGAMNRIVEAKEDLKSAMNLGFKQIDPTFKESIGL